MNGSHYSDEDRLRAVSAYAITGSFRKVEERTGIPHQTVHAWSQTEWWESLLGQVRTLNKDRYQSVFAGFLEKVAVELQDRLENGDPIVDKEGQTVGRKPVSAKELGILAAIAYDKMALIAGDPTSRVERVNSEDKMAELADRFAAINQRAKDKQASDSAVKH